MEYIILYFVVGLIPWLAYCYMLYLNQDPIKITMPNKKFKIIFSYIIWPYIILIIAYNDCKFKE